MKRKLIPLLALLSLLSLLSLFGCSRTQIVAAKAMEEGLNHAHQVYVNTSDMTKQFILNDGAAKAALAAQAGDVAAAHAAIQEVFDNMQNLGYLNIQWERARALLRTPQEYIWSRRSIFSILHSDLKKAKKRADEKRSEELKSNK